MDAVALSQLRRRRWLFAVPSLIILLLMLVNAVGDGASWLAIGFTGLAVVLVLGFGFTTIKRREISRQASRSPAETMVAFARFRGRELLESPLLRERTAALDVGRLGRARGWAEGEIHFGQIGLYFSPGRIASATSLEPFELRYGDIVGCHVVHQPLNFNAVLWLKLADGSTISPEIRGQKLLHSVVADLQAAGRLPATDVCE